MKNLWLLASLSASLLFVNPAFAQTPEGDAPTNTKEVTACSPVAQPEDIANAVDNPSPNEQSGQDNETLAQLARRRPGGLYPRRGGYPGRGYPSVAMPEGNPRYVLIGALIGFGLGAALGAKANTDQHPGAGVGAAVLFGTFGGLIGAAIGHGVPSFYTRNGHHHRESWEDEEASNLSPVLSKQTRVSRQEPQIPRTPIKEILIQPRHPEAIFRSTGTSGRSRRISLIGGNKAVTDGNDLAREQSKLVIYCV